MQEPSESPSGSREDDARDVDYRQLFESNPQPMWVYDVVSLEFLAVNAAAIQRYGFTREAFLRMTLLDIRPPEDVPRLLASTRSRQGNEGPEQSGPWRHTTSSGELLDVEIISHPVVYGNRAARHVTAIDVRARLEAQHAREAAEQLIMHAVREAPVPLIIYAEDGRVLALSRTWCEITGYCPEELPTLEAWTRLAYGDHQQDVLHGISRLFGLTSSTREGEFRIRCKDGSTRTWEFSSVGLPTLPNGTRTAMSIAADVTERRQVESALRRSLDMIALAHESAQIGTWEYDEATREVTLHPTSAVLYGYPAKIQQLPLEQWRTRIHPEDLAYIAPTAQAGIHGRTPFVKQFRTVWPDGSQHWIEEWSYSTGGANDESSRVYGIDREITPRVEREAELQRSLERLERSMRSTVSTISRMVELRDPYTAGHEFRVATIAADIGRSLGLSEHECEGLRLIGQLHDVGKITCPSEILSKPGKLSAVEFEMIKSHAEQGYQILKDLDFDWPVADVVRQHHERLDGTGYPRGLQGDQILLEARILAVADVIEAIVSHRPYRPALSLEIAMAELSSHRGTKYDPRVVDTALALFAGGDYLLPK